MTDGRHIGKGWKCYNSLTNGPIWMQRGRRDAVAWQFLNIQQ